MALKENSMLSWQLLSVFIRPECFFGGERFNNKVYFIESYFSCWRSSIIITPTTFQRNINVTFNYIKMILELFNATLHCNRYFFQFRATRSLMLIKKFYQTVVVSYHLFIVCKHDIPLLTSHNLLVKKISLSFNIFCVTIRLRRNIRKILCVSTFSWLKHNYYAAVWINLVLGRLGPQRQQQTWNTTCKDF